MSGVREHMLVSGVREHVECERARGVCLVRESM